MTAMNLEGAAKKFMQEFGSDLMTAHGFNRDRVFGIRRQALAADNLTGEVFLLVTLMGDLDGRPLKLVEMPFYDPTWPDEEVVAALEHHLGLVRKDAVLRLRRAGLLEVDRRDLMSTRHLFVTNRTFGL